MWMPKFGTVEGSQDVHKEGRKVLLKTDKASQ